MKPPRLRTKLTLFYAALTAFLLNPQTKKEGEIKAGEKATVHYKVENGSDVASPSSPAHASPNPGEVARRSEMRETRAPFRGRAA
jgi:hypothetical protein